MKILFLKIIKFILPQLYDIYISKSSTINGVVKVSKCNDIVSFKILKKGHEDRNAILIENILEADSCCNLKSFPPLYFSTGDKYDPLNDLHYSSPNGKKTYPDFVFSRWVSVGINDYDDLCQSLYSIDTSIFEKNQIGWIGNVDLSKNREKLFELSKKREFLDIINTGHWRKIETSKMLRTTKSDYLSIFDLVKRYKYLLDIEGVGYSGRYKILLHSGRPLFFIERPHVEYFHDDLKPFVHYIPVSRDLSDLNEKYIWAEDNQELVKKIAQSAQVYAKKHLNKKEAIYTLSKLLK